MIAQKLLSKILLIEFLRVMMITKKKHHLKILVPNQRNLSQEKMIDNKVNLKIGEIQIDLPNLLGPEKDTIEMALETAADVDLTTDIIERTEE